MTITALVTNDDGIASEGLRRLALVALTAGLRTVVAAPREEASGSSAASVPGSCSAFESETPILT